MTSIERFIIVRRFLYFKFWRKERNKKTVQNYRRTKRRWEHSKKM